GEFMGWLKWLAGLLQPGGRPGHTTSGGRRGTGPGGRRARLPLLCEALEARALLAAGGGFTNGGLQGQYFGNPTLSGAPAFTRQDVRVDYNWSSSPNWGDNAVAISGSPSIPFPSTNFSIRWAGQFIPQFSESYTFTVYS